MFDKIFNLLFEKKKSTSCLTVVKKREMKTMPLFYLKKHLRQKILIRCYYTPHHRLFQPHILRTQKRSRQPSAPFDVYDIKSVLCVF